jgi:hypothetical protein
MGCNWKAKPGKRGKRAAKRLNQGAEGVKERLGIIFRKFLPGAEEKLTFAHANRKRRGSLKRRQGVIGAKQSEAVTGSEKGIKKSEKRFWKSKKASYLCTPNRKRKGNVEKAERRMITRKSITAIVNDIQVRNREGMAKSSFKK